MAEVIVMTQLSPTMEEGRLVEWLKKEGDSVEAGDILAEVETDKATMEMESFEDGILLKILAAEGDAVPVGTPLAIIGEEGEDIDAALSRLGAGNEQDDTAPTPAASATQEAETPAIEAEPAASSAAREGNARIFASPVARKMASAKGIDLSLVNGSGPGGRIVKKDVEAAQKVASARPAPAAPAPAVSLPVELPTTLPPSQSVALSPMRKAIARNLTAAWQAPAFMLTRRIRMDRAMALRKQLNADLAAVDGGKVSVNDMVIKACALALREVPEMNAAWAGDHIEAFERADIGIAVAIDGGLITPVVRAAETKGLAHIAAEARGLALKARDKKLQPDDFTGSTFSISNLGMFGIDHFTAVLNPPAAGILAVGAVKKEPCVGEDGSLEVGELMHVTLTCDHRVIDGVGGARFLDAVVRRLERPLLLLV